MTIKLGDKLMDFSEPKIMGILNVTPDSFYAESRVTTQSALLSRIQRFILDGADIIDLGAVSTRPNADFVSENEEMTRLRDVLKLVRTHFPDIVISVDTFRASVARMAVEQGADIINDVSGGGLDSQMFRTVADLGVPYILMHNRGDSKTMMENTNYKNVTVDVVKELSLQLSELRQLGVKDVIVDPGFGFAKTLEHNYELLANLNHFKVLDVPILAGLSRKSMIYKLLDLSPDEALNGTTALNMVALLNGANIIRVHDVKEANQVKKLFCALNSYK